MAWAFPMALALAAAVAVPSVIATPPVQSPPAVAPPVTGAEGTDPFARTRVPPMLLSPLPRRGSVPRMAPAQVRPGTPDQWARFDAAFGVLRSRAFGPSAPSKARAEGIATVRGSVDPASFDSMRTAFRGGKHDVSLAMLDAFAAGGAYGHYSLARVAIEDDDAAVRAEATRRIALPPCPAVLSAIDDGLRSDDHGRVDRAGILAGAVHAIEAIPTLVFAQYAQGPVPERGDRAWIAVGRTVSYVANVVPVVGDNAGAYQPVIGQIIEGVVMRIQDCAVVIYHGGVHDALVAMTTYDAGMDTSANGWDIRAWARWFDEQYVPLKRRQDEELARASAGPGD